MSDEPENILLVYMRRLDAKMDALSTDVRDVKHRLTALEIQVANLSSIEASHYASLAARLDRMEDRLDRVERRLDIVPV